MAAQETYVTLPSHLEPFRHLLEKSALPAIILHTSPAMLTNASQSKIGGAAYVESGMAIPLDSYAEPMLLLAQINFAEAQLQAPFPTTGLLQFFISATAYLQANVEQGFISPSLFHIRFIANAKETSGCSMSTITPALWDEQTLTFSRQLEPVSSTDYRLAQFVDAQSIAQFHSQHYVHFDDIYAQSFLAADQKLGGYPYFIEQDFRLTDEKYRSYDILLFQLVSDDEIGFMWGDSGVIKFFITAQDLQRLDFSNVLAYSESY